MDYIAGKPADIAVYYAERGWSVLPVMANEKRPAIRNGVKGATRDPKLLHSYFDELSRHGSHPNIGIATGSASGFFVVDIDYRNDADAYLHAAELLGYDDLCDPATIQVDTPSGGQHWYFKMPGDAVGNFTNIAPGVDIKGEGGYVVAPGSVIDGRPYAFSREGDIAEAPVALLERLKKVPPAGDGQLTWDDTEVVAQGSRNNALFRYGCRLVNYGMAPEEMLAAMRARNEAYRPPLPSAEVLAIVKNIVRNYGRGQQPLHASNRLLSMRDLQAMPRPVPLVGDVLFSDMEHVLFGEQGTSKTFILLDWFLHVVHGIRWHDKNVQVGKVVYVCGEGGGRVLADRLEAWHTYHKRDPSLTNERLRITEFPVPLLQDECVEELLSLIQDWGTVAAIGIDTLSANFGPGDENTQVDMGRFCAAVRRIRLETRAGMVVVHHTGHADKSRPQGANKIRRDFDVELRVARDSTDDALFGLLGGGQLKNRNGRGCGLVPFRLEIVDLGCENFGIPVESAVVVPTTDEPQLEGGRSSGAPAQGRGRNQRRVVAALTEAAEKSGQPLDSDDGVLLSTPELEAARKQSGLVAKRWNEVIRGFEKQGVIQRSAGGVKWHP